MYDNGINLQNCLLFKDNLQTSLSSFIFMLSQTNVVSINTLRKNNQEISIVSPSCAWSIKKGVANEPSKTCMQEKNNNHQENKTRFLWKK